MSGVLSSLSDLLERESLSSSLDVEDSSLDSTTSSDVDGGNPISFNAVIGDEFERSRPPSSLSRQLASITPPSTSAMPTNIDFRALEYLPDYDPRLMCPICHVPFLDPVRLSCDHMFCYTCYKTYRASSSGPNRGCCPTCRTALPLNKTYARKDVPRMIVNMCNDIKTHCPYFSQGCPEIMSRDLVSYHAARCMYEPVACPQPTCSKLTRRQDLDRGRCRHGIVRCVACGADVMHQDFPYHLKECPTDKCAYCGWWQATEGITMEDHQKTCLQLPRKCSGEIFGCKVTLKHAELESHQESCPFVVMGPYLESTSKRIDTLESNLAAQKIRNEGLEGCYKQLWDIVKVHIVPTMSDWQPSTQQSELVSTSSAPVPHTSTSQTPRSITSNGPLIHPSHNFSSRSRHAINQRLPISSAPAPSPSSDGLNHLLSLHEVLRTEVLSMNSRIDSISSSLQHFMSSYTDSESRANMMLINDVLRMKEEVAHTSAAMSSMRSQLTWLIRIHSFGAARATGAGAAGAAGAGAAVGRQIGDPGGQIVPVDAREQTEGASSSRAAGLSGPSSSDGGPLIVGYVRRSSDGHSSQEKMKL